MDRKTINRIELARHATEVDRYIRVARGLGVPLTWLFAQDSEPPQGGGSGGGDDTPPLRQWPPR